MAKAQAYHTATWPQNASYLFM